MDKRIFTMENIKAMVKPLAEKYHAKEVYLFGSYARGEADENSDLDFLVFGGENFKLDKHICIRRRLARGSAEEG